MDDLHKVVFRWSSIRIFAIMLCLLNFYASFRPYDAQDVIVTGTFDQWSSSVHLTKGPSGFEATVRVPWSEKVPYKFIVDGRWTTTDQAPTEVDPAGNMNNVYYAPMKPVVPTKVNESPLVASASASEPQDNAPDSLPTFQDKVAPDVLLNDTLAASRSAEPVPIPSEMVAPEILLNKTPAASQTEPVSSPEKPFVSNTDTEKPAVVEPVQIPRKISMPIVPVNDSRQIPISIPDAPKSDSASTPSTHALPINSSKNPTNSSSSPLTTVTAEAEKHTIGTSSISSPPTTPVKHAFPSGEPESPISSKDGSLRSSKFGSIRGSGSTRAKRNSVFGKLKTLFTPEKDKDKHKEKK